jgi:hypothetical protein
MGSPAYAIGSPLFTKATVNLENGRKIVVNAPRNSATNVYVQSLKVNGKAYTSTSLPHALLAKGATLDFAMGPKPSTWGSRAQDAPPSITSGTAVPSPLADLTGPGRGTATDAALVDDTSATRATFPTATPTWQYRFAGTGERAEYYTLTSGATAGDPTAWQLRGSYDGIRWATIDQRTGETFADRLQTRPFRISTPGRYQYYQLVVTANTGGASTTLAEVELLGHPAAACTSTIGDTVRGSITIKSGVTCLTSTATVTGQVTVTRGAALIATGATLRGAVTATGAGAVTLLNTTVTGAVQLTKSGPVSLENSTIRGRATLTDNTGPSLVSGNTVIGDLICTGNRPGPVNNGLANTVTGQRRSQCGKL